MHLPINDQIYLTEFRPTDKTACVQHLQEREIYERPIRIPYPYTEADFDNWLATIAKATEQHGEPVHFAIRTSDDSFIGHGNLQAAANAVTERRFRPAVLRPDDERW